MEMQLICRKEHGIHMKNTNIVTENEELETSELQIMLKRNASSATAERLFHF